MGVGRIDIYLLLAIFISSLYLYVKEPERSVYVAEEIDGDDDDDISDAKHSVRGGCPTTANALNEFVLDLTFSIFPDEKVESLGQEILNDLFNVSC